MKIGVYDPYLDTLSGGEKYMLSIAKCLSDKNEVSIFWDNEQEIRKVAKNKLGIDLENIKFIKNIFSSSTPFLERYKATRKFDSIIYLSDGSIPLVGCKLFIHFQFPVEWVKNYPKTKLKLLKVKKIICNSVFTKELIDKKFGTKSVVLYPPASSFNPGKKENIILHVGRLGIEDGVNYKKQDVMINTFKEMVDEGLKNWKFVLVVGVKKEHTNNLELLKKMTIDYPIEIIGSPSSEILADCYSKSKIYWHATGFGEDLNKNPEKAEHFGMSTVEAMSAGSVPVVINAGGQREIVTDESGFLWDTLDQMSNYTLKLIKEEKLWNDMSKSSIQRSGVFTGERFCRELREIIR